MTTINSNTSNLPARTPKQNAATDICFVKNEKYAVILPAGFFHQKKTYTMHRSERAASRWALRLESKNLKVTIIDKSGAIYTAERDTETAEYKLIATDKTLENITIC